MGSITLRMAHYILDDRGQPHVEPDWEKWAQWFATHGDARIVGKTQIGSVKVSTVFLGINHQWGHGPPILWETLVRGGHLHEAQERYTSQAEAVAGHEEMVKRVLEADGGDA